MASGELRYDPENPKSNLTEQSLLSGWQPAMPTLFYQSAGLLALWSILVLNEGAIRLMDSNPAGGFTNPENGPPNVVLFIGALAEVVFGILGILIGLAAVIAKAYDTNITKIAMVIQTLLGYYVFIVFVFLPPVYTARNINEESDLVLRGLSVGQAKYFIVLGLLTSFNFCLALQGGQFVFFARLISGATGKDFLKQTSGNRMRAIFWNSNFGLSGLYTLIAGALIHSNIGGGKLDEPFISPPIIGRVPLLTIITGLIMMLWGFLGSGSVMMGFKLPNMYYWLSMAVYVFTYSSFTIIQLGLIANPLPAPPSVFGNPTAVIGGLVFMTVFLGPYFAYQASQDEKAEK